MAIALMSLGDCVFQIPSVDVETLNFDRLSRDSSYTWVPQGRLNAPVAMQYTGPGQDLISIEGRLHPHWFGGLQTLSDLRTAAAAGKPLELIRFYPTNDSSSSYGVIAQMLGSWVIMRIRAGERDIASDGVANHIDFSLELARYGNDQTTVSQDAQISTVTTQSTQAQTSQQSVSAGPDPRIVAQ